jgi:hypothetical protein
MSDKGVKSSASAVDRRLEARLVPARRLERALRMRGAARDGSHAAVCQSRAQDALTRGLQAERGAHRGDILVDALG